MSAWECHPHSPPPIPSCPFPSVSSPSARHCVILNTRRQCVILHFTPTITRTARSDCPPPPPPLPTPPIQPLPRPSDPFVDPIRRFAARRNRRRFPWSGRAPAESQAEVGWRAWLSRLPSPMSYATEFQPKCASREKGAGNSEILSPAILAASLTLSPGKSDWQPHQAHLVSSDAKLK